MALALLGEWLLWLLPVLLLLPAFGLLLILLLAVLLTLPLELRLRLHEAGPPQGSLTATWAWGVVRRQVWPGGRRSPHGQRPKPNPNPKRGKRRGGWRLPRDPAVWQEGLALLRRWRRAARVTGSGRVVFGFETPDLTGLACAIVPALRLPTGLQVEPDFLTPGLRGPAEITLRIQPVVWGYHLILSLLKPPVRKYWWAEYRRHRALKRARRRTGQRRTRIRPKSKEDAA